MVLTARAEQLVEPVRAVLEQIRTTISVTPPFDPAISDRTIRIMASDYIAEVLLTTALTEIQSDAPNMRFVIQSMSEQLTESLDRGLVDLLITIDYAISSDHPSQILLQDDYVVVGWNQNPAMAGPMTLDLYLELSHVTTRFGSARASAFEDWFVRRQKQQRKVDIVTATFLSMPSFVIGSDRIATMHRRLATKLAAHLPLIIREVPLDIPPIREAIQWHISNNNDPAIRWIVERLAAAAQAPAFDADKVIALGEARARQPSHEEITAQFQSHTASQGRAS